MAIKNPHRNRGTSAADLSKAEYKPCRSIIMYEHLFLFYDGGQKNENNYNYLKVVSDSDINQLS